MKTFVVYTVASGRIRAYGSCRDEDVDLQVTNYGEVVKAIDGPEPRSALHYVVNGQIVDRPTVSLEDAPPGTAYEVANGETWHRFAGTLPDTGLVIDLPGTWHVRLTPPWPYRELSDVVVVAG